MFKVVRVVAVHPESHAVDVVVMDDGRRLAGVQVLSGLAGGNVGLSDLPEPSVTDPQKPFESANTGERDVYALLTFVGRDMPVIVGFLYPQVAQCLFARKNFRVDRHASDVYSTIDEAGNIEIAHPSGTFIRIAENLAHEDLTGQDYDGQWKTTKNAARLPGLRVQIANSGGVKATLSIDAAGNVSLTNAGTTTISSGGDMSLSSGGAMSLSATGDVTVTGANIHLN
jgi:hypothetical protein